MRQVAQAARRLRVDASASCSHVAKLSFAGEAELSSNAVLHHPRMLSDESMDAFVDEAAYLVIGYLKGQLLCRTESKGALLIIVRSPAAIRAAWRKAGVLPPRDRGARRRARAGSAGRVHPSAGDREGERFVRRRRGAVRLKPHRTGLPSRHHADVCAGSGCHFVRVSIATQLISHVLPPSSEKACSKRTVSASSGVITKRTKTARPSKSSWS